MAVDIGALRKFQDLWGPVLESIPAVMDAVAKQADFERALRAAQTELDKANAEVKAAKDEAESIRTKSAEALEAMNAKLKETMAAADRRAFDAEEESRARIVRAKEKAATAEQQAISQEATVKAAQAQVQNKIAEAQQEHSKIIAELSAEVKALEERKASVEAAIDALKSKLG